MIHPSQCTHSLSLLHLKPRTSLHPSHPIHLPVPALPSHTLSPAASHFQFPHTLPHSCLYPSFPLHSHLTHLPTTPASPHHSLSMACWSAPFSAILYSAPKHRKCAWIDSARCSVAAGPGSGPSIEDKAEAGSVRHRSTRSAHGHRTVSVSLTVSHCQALSLNHSNSHNNTVIVIVIQCGQHVPPALV